ncbi:bcl-2-modifying factor [Ornithorhynchus anatinus]|nr:bcl-2-modifying factor [Ornithorhynchus anatinus]
MELSQYEEELEELTGLEELEDDVFHPETPVAESLAQPGGPAPAAPLTPGQPYSYLVGQLPLFPLAPCCGPGLRTLSQEDKTTQTLSPAAPSQGVMLPCGVTEEPRRLFYGHAGYRLSSLTSFPGDPSLGEEPPEAPWERRPEMQVARKLQCIADQFHRLHTQRHQRNRNHVWWRVLPLLHNLALGMEENGQGGGPR